MQTRTHIKKGIEMSDNRYKILKNLTLLTQIGIVMVVPIMVGLFIGRFLDNKLNTGYLFLFIFLIMGVVAAFVNLFKIAMKKDD
jgi:F0F1-type ATP synthase assembly protein I